MSVHAWPHGDPDAVVRSVLAQSAFRGAGRTTNAASARSLLAQLWSWFVEHVLQPLFHPFGRALAAAGGVGSALDVALVVLALGALAFALVRLALAFARPPRTRRPAGKATRLASDTTADQWRSAGRTAASAGEYARAVAAFFAAALAALHERDIIAFDASRTPEEYRWLVRRLRVRSAAPFDELAGRFARAAFAPGPAHADDAARAERALAAFEPALVAPAARTDQL